MKTTANIEEINKIIKGESKDPHYTLGMHSIEQDGITKISIRVFIPGVVKVKIKNLQTHQSFYAAATGYDGFFEYICESTPFKYKIEAFIDDGSSFEIYDPYAFSIEPSSYDLYLFNQGNYHKAYDILGAKITNIDGTDGVLFSVWAPNAKRVSVVGNFNQWNGLRHQMKLFQDFGVWQLFIPGLMEGDIYKFEIKTPAGQIYIKSDPYGYYSELRPATASIVWNVDKYIWNDSKWIEERENSNHFEKPASIYEVHLGSWDRHSLEQDIDTDADEPRKGDFLTYRELAEKLVKYVKGMGFTHIELLPVMEHPFDGSWGYQVTGYYSVTSRYGTPEDFMYFVDTCHQNGIGVIMDWVPAHFPKDGHGLARFDGTALYEHADPRQGEHPEWGTHIFNYGRNEVRNFLISNALFWIEKYHIDGLRVDAVASMLYLNYAKKPGEWIPNKYGGAENLEAVRFIKQLNTTVYKYFPGIQMIAEESTSWPMVCKPPYIGGLGFSYKWNMGWMNDYLKYCSMDSIYRKYHHNLLTFSLMYAFNENFVLVLSHDEVVHGKKSMVNKMPGDYWQKFAGLRVCYGYMFGHPGKKCLFMGNEFGQFIEWNYKQSLDWFLLKYPAHSAMKKFVMELNKIYLENKCLYISDFGWDGFEWIDCNDSQHSIISFIRKTNNNDEFLIFVCNFTPVVHYGYRLGVPSEGFYRELLNSDSEIFGGSNVGNLGGVLSDKISSHGREFSIAVTIPPLSVLILKPEALPAQDLEQGAVFRMGTHLC